MQHSTFVTFFKQAAERHHAIKHNEVGSQYINGKRCSFFSGSDYRQWQQSENNQVDYPLMHIAPAFGSFAENGMVYSDRAVLKYEIFKQVDNLDDYAAIDAAYNDCKIIALEFLALIKEDIEQYGYCAALGNVNFVSVSYEFVGPINDRAYGISVSFLSESDAYDPTQIDIASLFPN